MSRLAPAGAIAVVAVVSVIELAATYASLGAAPMSLVEGWGLTRPTDWVSFVLVAAGCTALFALRRFPATAALGTAVAYCAFIVRDYEFGMSLPVMVAIYVLSTRGHRTTALIAALCAVAASLVWVANRAAPAVDPGVSTLIWVAFGTVLGVFFLAPFMAGEIVRLRRAARHLERVHGVAGSPA